MATKKTATESTAAVYSQTMYIGPSVRALGLVSGRVYLGDIGVITAPLVEKYPLINRLFAPIGQIVEAKARMKTKGTAEYLAAAQIVGGEN